MTTRKSFKQVTLTISESVYKRADWLAKFSRSTLEEVLADSIAFQKVTYPNVVLKAPHQRVEVDFVTMQERTIQTTEGKQVHISKDQHFKGSLIVWHNEKDLLEKYCRHANNLEGVEGESGMISVHAYLASNGKSYEYRGYLQYHDLHFHQGEHVSKTPQMDFFNCPTLQWVVDSRYIVPLFIDGEKILVREKYMTADVSFTIDIRNVFVKCTFFDSELWDCRTVYYRRKIEEILFLPTFTVEYEEGKIVALYREADNPVDLAVY